MIWLALIFTGLVTAAAGALLAGAVAAGAVKWYSISSFEGGSGYFVAAIGIMGMFAGLVIGLVCAGMSGADSVGHFFRGTGVALGITLALAGVAAGITRGLADIPPEIDGEDLFLVVDVRCPADQTTSPANEAGDAYLLLGSIPPLRHTVRKH